MPICKREGFDLNQKEGKNETFHDNDQVFCCYITKRIFRDYEHYFRHVMVINSTVWQCEATGKENLTYEEAVKSERAARKKMEQFKQSLRAPVLLVVEHAQQSAVNTLNMIVAKFLRKRYFIGEEVSVQAKKNATYTVLGVKLDKNMPEPLNGIYEDTDNLVYRLRPNKGDPSAELDLPFRQLRRSRMEFNLENLSMFIKSNVSRVDGLLRPKPEAYKQYVTDPGVNFSTIFIGKMPRYSPAKIKKPDGKKQSTLNKYIVAGEATAAKSKAKAKSDAKSLAEELERVKREKEAKLIELEKQKAEKKAQLIERVENECNLLLQKTDDLERTDQKVLPRYRQIVTLLPEHLLGDAFMMREFMHTYTGLLSGIEVFRQNLSFYEMTRALTAREIAGPLSDILLVLLGTVFDLQKEEEEECAVTYLDRAAQTQEPYWSMAQAAKSHLYAKRHFSFKVNELPLDALTLSEVLRLHLLGSGAFVNEKAERWRVMYRNGYSSKEDPGLELRLEHSHILRILKNHSVYQLKFKDIMLLIRCLMSQIMTYSGTINLIEERMEQTAKARQDLRALVVGENKRLAAVEINRKKLTQMHHLEVNGVEPEKREALVEKLKKSIAELHAQSDQQHRKHELQMLKLHSQLFNFLVYLGMDRCYRKYYVLESMPGIFVEHSPDSLDTCLEQPITNKSQIEIRQQSALPKNRKDLRVYLLKLYGDDEKKTKKKAKHSLENKENQEHRLNGSAEPMDVESDSPEAPTHFELLMCSGDKRSCIVHDSRNGQRQRWAYIYKAEEIDELIKALNPNGLREYELLQELSVLRSLIEQHAKTCPVDLLSLENETMRKKFMAAMESETNRKYGEANFGLPNGTDLNEVMRLHLVDRIIQFENDIYTGDLGRLKVKDMEKWRSDLLGGNYDAQCKLQWGPGGKLEDEAGSDNESHETHEEDDGALLGKYARKPYRDPGMYLAASADTKPLPDSDDEEDQHTNAVSIPIAVHNMASALLQVEQAIGKRFLKEPYGMKKWDPKQEALKLACDSRLHQWEVSLMESTSFAQVFLHLNILHDCIQWRRSTNKSLCKVCRRGSDPEKMLLCDECNAGTHMFCLKPKLRSVPPGNWYCNDCVKSLGLSNGQNEKDKKQATKKKRKFIVEEEDDEATDEEEEEKKDDDMTDEDAEHENEKHDEDVEDDESVTSTPSSSRVNGRILRRPRTRPTSRRLTSKEIEEHAQEDVDSGDVSDDASLTAGEDTIEDESDEEKVCQKCFYDGGEIKCVQCRLFFHLECVHLKRPPRTDFVCKTCKPMPQRPRRRHSNMNGDHDRDEEEPKAKRPRNSLRLSIDKTARPSNGNNNNNNNNSSVNNNNHRRSGRRTNEHMPLNSAALYDLLEQIMKHKAAWPFLRPVLTSEVPDYHQIIKTPMDLAKIKSKLNMGAYQLNEELLSDIQLVFRNCDLYNVEGNEIYDAGCQLERFVIDRCRDMQLPFRPSDMNGEVKAC
uniref:ATP-dependent chromatin assembly factor large subunit n=2 Tax=Drosophila melanogaster TaxID=7227 RepID=Q9V9T4_DROME|nr:ATP-dependent chromatin assembly factor large subunit [Drosophila melanogaster]AAF57200.1 ATP-dependent chromatin assembly factor large subunit [Drosophila melanogaster]|eukprot:NP_536734.2 ATP-dependent chromatin assembly factor large subunit [Drosophila melanogaster]